MGKRSQGERSETAVNLSGDLRSSLHRHTIERANHFFYYLFTMKALVDYLNRTAHLGLDADAGVEVSATLQIDTGFRRLKTHAGIYHTFDDSDAGVVTLSTSNFGSMDAAHFCNLGIKPAFVTRISSFITQKYMATDPLPFALYEELKKFCGDTQLLPQRVNIGPDRVIDQMHGDLAGPMLTASTKVTSATNVANYRSAAISRMQEYCNAAVKNGDLGISACAECYLEMYQDTMVLTPEARRKVRVDYARKVQNHRPGQALPDVPEPPRLPFAQTVLSTITAAAVGRCIASNGALNPVDYVA